MHKGDKLFILREAARKEISRFAEAIRELAVAKEMYKKTLDIKSPTFVPKKSNPVFPGIL